MVAPSDSSMTTPRPNQVHAWGLKVSSTLGAIHVYISTAPKVEKQMDADSLFGIPVPKSISGLHRGEITNNEVTSPGLGFTVPYHGPMIEATLYIYDLGLKEIPANLLDDSVRQHFDGATRDVLSLPRHGQYNSVALVSRYATGSSEIGPEFLCATFSVMDQDKSFMSFLFLTTHSDRFVKWRISIHHNESEEAVARMIVDAYADMLWPGHAALRPK